MSHVQLSEGGFQVVYPLCLWSRFSGVVKVRFGYGLLIINIHIYIYTYVDACAASRTYAPIYPP